MKTRLKRTRKAVGISLHALSDATGLKHNTISRYENKLLEPSISAAFKLSNALGKTIEELFGDWR